MPDFLCIGAPKAGTSWLYHNIKLHPNVRMPPIKEIGYFDGLIPALPLVASVFDPTTWTARKTTLHRLRTGYARRNRKLVQWCLRFLVLPRSDKWYTSLFSPDQGQITGDITPTYASMSTTRVAKVHALLPNTKIIYLLRNPITQIWSHTAMHFSFWGRRGLDEITNKEIQDYLDKRKRSKITSYLGNLQTWMRFYPESQAFVGFYDQLTQDPVVLFKDICRFLGLEDPSSVTPEAILRKHNVGRYPEIPDTFNRYLARQYHKQIEQLHRRFHNQYTADWLDFAERWL